MNNETANPIEMILAEAREKKEAKKATNSNSFVNEAVNDQNRHFSIVIVLLVVGCLGGVAVGLGALSSILQISLLVFPVMATLSLLLAVQPMKYIMASAAIACIIDVIIIAVNIL